jgi:hypothetical protein
MMARRHPEHSLEPLFTRLKRGESFDSALLTTTGSTVGRFEVEWQKDVRKRYGLLVWAMAGGLWLVVAVGVLLAGWLRRRRDRPRRAALDEGWVVEPEGPEEQAPPLDRSAPAP